MRYRRPLIVATHLAFIVLANYLAFWLRFDGAIPNQYAKVFIQMLPWVIVIRGLTFIPFRLYEGLWRYTGIWDLRNIVMGVFSSTLMFYFLVHWGFGLAGYPRSVFFIDGIVLILLLGGVRLSRRIYRELWHLEGGKRVLVYGAGDAGEMIVRDMKNNGRYDYEPIGFVDDDPGKIGRRIHGVQILGTREDLPTIMSTQRPDEVLVAIPAAQPAAIRKIVKALEPFKVPIKTLPSLRDILDGKVSVHQIRHLSVEDLLSRAPVGLDPGPIRELLAGKRVLVTGAGGSIGSELCRQVAASMPAALVLYERYENGLFTISSELSDRHGSLPIHSIIGDVTDPARVNEMMEQCRPDIVFHAAAHKHVPLMELNPCEAIKNNVVGTRVVAEAAAHHGAERFILISSDKAVNPSSIMGASKRVAELIVQDLSVRSRTSFVVVRFGNVLGSSGSVLPRFIEQVKAGRAVTVTHPEVYRYFMLISEAVQLVLHAAARNQSGSIYVLEMGEPVSVLEMARNVIRLSGFVPEEDIPIKFVGLRPGEKLFEDLIGSDETAESSEVEGILKIRPMSPPDPAQLGEQVSRLEGLAAQGGPRAAVEQLSKIVPTFQFQRGERRRQPPHYRAALVRNTLPRLARCQTAEDLLGLLEEVRRELGFETLEIRFKTEDPKAVPTRPSEFLVVDPNPPRDPNVVIPDGAPSWSGSCQIVSRAGAEGQVVGEVLAAKPAWRRRRASENDDELLQLLAEGLGQWIATHQETPQSQQPASASQPNLAIRLLNGLLNGRPPRRSG